MRFTIVFSCYFYEKLVTLFADAWPRAIETEIGATQCAIGAGGTYAILYYIIHSNILCCKVIYIL